MIISKNWLNEWVDLSEISDEKLMKTLNSIGLEVDSSKEISVPSLVVVGKILSLKKHPDADKLNLCNVDIGSEVLPIVCGASNVKEGQFIALAKIGAVLPNGIEIKEAKLRGEPSYGMICSSTELGLDRINSGIMELDESIGELILGKELRSYPCFNDSVIEVDVTANRGDCQSVMGIARDVASALDLNLKSFDSFKDSENSFGIGRIISIHAQEGLNASVAYRAFNLNNPLKENLLMNLRLAFSKSEETSMISKLIHYAMLNTGVLLRAYDYNKFNSEKVSFNLNNSEQGVIVSYLDRQISTIGICSDDFYLADDESKNIILEASYINPDEICKIKGYKSNFYNYLSSRGSEPNLHVGTDFVFKILKKSANLFAGSLHSFPNFEPKIINLNLSDLNLMIGQEIDRNEIFKILKRLGFEINFNSDQNLNLKVPNFRHDIFNSHDVCEEILRIVGIDFINSKPLVFEESSKINKSFLDYKKALNFRQKAANNGFFECVSYIFDSEGELADFGFKPCKVEIANPINNELNHLRPSIINHLLKFCEKNIKNQKKSVKLFELGIVFDENANESKKLSFVHCGLEFESSFLNGTKPNNINLLKFANNIQNIIGKIELKNSKNEKYLSPFEQAEIYQDGKKIGFMGAIHLEILEKRELPKTYFCELDFELLRLNEIKSKIWSKFPSVSRELSLLLPKNLNYEQIKDTINNIKLDNLKEFYPIDLYKNDEKSSLSIRFIFEDKNKTLLDDEVAIYMDKILKELNKLEMILR